MIVHSVDLEMGHGGEEVAGHIVSQVQVGRGHHHCHGAPGSGGRRLNSAGLPEWEILSKETERDGQLLYALLALVRRLLGLRSPVEKLGNPWGQPVLERERL